MGILLPIVFFSTTLEMNRCQRAALKTYDIREGCEGANRTRCSFDNSKRRVLVMGDHNSHSLHNRQRLTLFDVGVYDSKRLVSMKSFLDNAVVQSVHNFFLYCEKKCFWMSDEKLVSTVFE